MGETPSWFFAKKIASLISIFLMEAAIRKRIFNAHRRFIDSIENNKKILR